MISCVKNGGRSKAFVRWGPLTLLLAVCFGLNSWAFREQPQEEIDGLAALAKKAQASGDYSAAAASYKRIVELRPFFVEARVNLGLMYHLSGQYELAVECFSLAVKKQPALFTANFLLGLDLLLVNQPAKAIPYLRHAVALNQKDVQAPLALGKAYASLDQYEKASNWYRAATEKDVANADAWYGLGVTYLRIAHSTVNQLARVDDESAYVQRLSAESEQNKGRAKAALTAYLRLRALSPNDLDIRSDLGFAYLLQNTPSHLDEAETEFRALQGEHPGFLPARLGLARVLVSREDFLSAGRELEVAWAADRKFVEVNIARAWFGAREEELGGIQAGFEQAFAGEAKSEVIRYLLPALEKWRHEPMSDLILQEESSPQPDFQNAMESKSSSPAELSSKGHYTACTNLLKPKLAVLSSEVLLLLANCSFKIGDNYATYLAGQQMIKLNSKSLAGLYWKAESAQHMGTGALARFGRMAPDSPRAHLLLAESYREQGRIQAAESEYGQILQSHPNDLTAHIGLAATFWSAADYAQAIPELKIVLKLQPEEPEASFMMAYILVTRHQFAEAMPYLRVVLNRPSPRLPHVHALLGEVYAAQGDPTQAIVHLKQSLESDTDGTYHFQLYQQYKKVGNEKAAAEAYHQAQVIRKKYQDK